MTFPFTRRSVAAATVAVLLTAGCSSATDTDLGADSTEPAVASVAGDSTSTSDSSSTGTATATQVVFDATTVHAISIEFDEADYDEMIAAYLSTGDKEWIEATVTIDGTTYTSAGVRLKGNSSLRGMGGSGGVGEQTAEELPWLIKLDKYVDGQNHEGVNDFVVRSNNSETSLNEAVALDLLEAAGLATQDAIAVRFSVNGSDETLRLVIEHPDDVWMADNFSADGALYKAESTGDYSYRGDDPDAYDEVFDQEAGKDNTDLTPLIEFLDFINNSDDATFAAEIDDWLDVDSFATYLAMQDIIQNFDDIDGPGNNSYLYWDADTGQFTVVPWDHNLAFGDAGFGIGGGGQGGAGGFERPDGAGRPDGFERPDGGTAPEGFEPPTGGAAPEGFERPDGAVDQAGGRQGGFGGPGGSNILVERLTADADFSGLVASKTAELTAELIDSGVAAEIVASWSAVLTDGASDIVSEATITSEADRLAGTLTA